MPPVLLRCRTSLSTLQASLHIETIVEAAEAIGADFIGLCDDRSLAAAPAFVRAARARRIQPILSTDLAFRDGRVMATALSAQGWRNLIALHNQLETNTPIRLQEADPALLEGLALLDGAPGSPLAQALLAGQAEAHARQMRQRTHSYFIEIRRTQTANSTHERSLDRISRHLQIPLVGTTTVAAAAGEDRMLALLASIATGLPMDRLPPDALPEGRTFPEASSIEAMFADAPEVLANTRRLAEAVDIDAGPEQQPLTPPYFESPHDDPRILAEIARAGLHTRLADGRAHAAPASTYEARLEHELRIITDLGFAGTFLIVRDYVTWARSQDIPVGPGRGSAAGSLTAWCTDITGLDPIAHGLVFERFINPSRVSPPDFDVDFCQDGRDAVLAHLRRRYGERRVAAIGTHSSWGARAAFRDAARALGLNLRLVNQVAILLPAQDPLDPDQLPSQVRELANSNPELQEALRLSAPLQGLVRQHSRHAAGVLIANHDLDRTIPLMRDPGGGPDPITQYDMADAEAAGFLKFDILGLRTLSIIRHTLTTISDGHPTRLREEDLPLTPDPAVSALFRTGRCQGIFQMESTGIVRTAQNLGIEDIRDVMALIALYRPGPMGHIEHVIETRRGTRQTPVLHPKITPILAETWGIPIYQEQIIQIAQAAAGLSAGDADLLRRAMGKKIPEVMAAQRQRFLDGCTAHGLDSQTAQQLWTMTERFAGYGFNKSHAAAYARITWWTAWLKAHHPAAFAAALLTYHAHNQERIAAIVTEARTHGLRFAPPRLGISRADFRIETTTTGPIIRWGLAALKGVGHNLARALQAACPRQPRSFHELAQYLAPLQLPTHVVTILADSGTLDDLDSNRARAAHRLNVLLRQHARTQTEPELALDDHDTPQNIPDHPPHARYQRERDILGVTLSGGPLGTLQGFEHRYGALPLEEARQAMTRAATPVLAMIESTGRGQIARVLCAEDQLEAVLDTDLPAADVPLRTWIAQRPSDRLPRIVQAETIPETPPRCLRLLLRGDHDWNAIRHILTRNGRGTDAADIRIDLPQSTHRRPVPPILRLDSTILDELASRPDVLAAQLDDSPTTTPEDPAAGDCPSPDETLYETHDIPD